MLKAIRDEVIVKTVWVEKKSLIHIPESATTFKQYGDDYYGVVVSVGQDVQACKNDVHIDSEVVWRRHEGKKIMWQGAEYRAIKEKWLLCLKD